jgi:Ca2+-binding EF-hand superfamily protein
MKLFFAVAAVAFVSLTMAWGQDEKSGEEHGPKRSPEEILKKLDTNNDGKISLDEWKASPRSQKDPARAQEMFNKLDANHDGFITLDELKAHPMGQHHHEHGQKGEKGEHTSPSPSPSAST